MNEVELQDEFWRKVGFWEGEGLSPLNAENRAWEDLKSEYPNEVAKLEAKHKEQTRTVLTSREIPTNAYEVKRYKTILIDPPWAEFGGGQIKRGADRHYNLMKTDDIIKAVLNSGVFTPDQTCHLYLWVTNNFLKDGLRVMEALGFRYITNLVWVKDRFGLGQYFRGQHELCLFGVKGVMMTQNRSTPTVIDERKTIHSKKPIKIYDIIESCSYSPRLEMFAREKRPGWDSWGTQLSKDVQLPLETIDNDKKELLEEIEGFPFKEQNPEAYELLKKEVH